MQTLDTKGLQDWRKKQPPRMHKVNNFFPVFTENKKKPNHLISWWQQKRCILVMKLDFIKERVGSSFWIFVMGAREAQFELPSVTLMLLLEKAGISWHSSSPTGLCYQEGSGEQEEVLLLNVHLDHRNSKNIFSWIFMLNNNQLHFLMSFCLPAITYSSSSNCPRNLSLANSPK